jgi:hypothetical protein
MNLLEIPHDIGKEAPPRFTQTSLATHFREVFDKVISNDTDRLLQIIEALAYELSSVTNLWEKDAALAHQVCVQHLIGLTFTLRQYVDEEAAALFAVGSRDVFETEIMKLREAGQKEYAHNEDTPFGNFERGARKVGLSREQVLWVYALKHLDGIRAYVDGHRSQREDVRGRINDFIVYMMLLHGMLQERIDSEYPR